MTTAIILINAARPELRTTIESLKTIEGVTEVYTVAGEFDIVAVLRLSSSSMLSSILADKIINITGITNTKTLIAIETHSKFDLKKMFNI